MTKKTPLLIIALTLSPLSYADQKLTFEDSIALAVKSNLEVQASYEALKSVQADKKSARGAFFPKVSAALTYEKANTENKSGASSTTDNYSGTLTLTQNLFNGFQDYSALKIADSKILSEEANLQETKAQISYDLKNAMANYFYAKDSLNLSKDIKKRREDNLRMVELRFDSGRENKGSVLLSKAYLEQAKLDLFKAENAMETSLIYLRRVLNLPENEPIEITTTPLVSDPGVPDYGAIIASTPTTKKFKATLAGATASLESSKSGFYPDVNLSASVGKTGADFFPDDNKRWSAGATLSWSLFDGGKDLYSTFSSEYQVKASEKRLENQNLEQRRILSQAYSNFREAISTVKVSAAFLEAAKVRADISRSKYNNGLSNFDDWDLIENDLINKQKDYNLQIRNRLQASAAWEQAQGTGVIP